tara:strand:+ start:2198 stop:3310 length:1113 start_codon:yes stop_codon:yes gene_type:complete
MKRILIATDNFLPRVDGIAVFLDRVIPELSKKYKITVLAPDFEGKRVWYKGVTIIKVPLSGRVVGDYPVAGFNRAMIKSVVKENDIVWTHSAGPIGSVASWYAKRNKKKIVTTVHSIEWELFFGAITFPRFFSGVFNWIVRKYIKNVYRRSNVLTVSSKGIKDLLDENGVKGRKVVVPLGVDTNKFRPSSYKRASKLKVGLKEGRKVIVYVGRIAREKNLLDLLDAYKDLKVKASLVVVGDGVISIKRKLKRNKVVVTGFVDNVDEYLQAADVYVIPSSTETSSLSTLEAMGSGLAVVSTGVGDMKNYLKNEKNALLFKTGDVEKLRENLEKLLVDAALRRELGREAQKTARKYSWDLTIKNLDIIFKEL